MSSKAKYIQLLIHLSLSYTKYLLTGLKVFHLYSIQSHLFHLCIRSNSWIYWSNFSKTMWSYENNADKYSWLIHFLNDRYLDSVGVPADEALGEAASRTFCQSAPRRAPQNDSLLCRGWKGKVAKVKSDSFHTLSPPRSCALCRAIWLTVALW